MDGEKELNDSVLLEQLDDKDDDDDDVCVFVYVCVWVS